MKFKNIFLIALVCIFSGALFFAIQRNWLIIHFGFSSSNNLSLSPSIKQVHQKAVRLFYQKNSKWLTENISIIWDEQNPAQNLKLLIKQWLALMQDEKLLPAHIALESVALSSQNSQAYVSFDHALFPSEWPMVKKWLILESLFKTVHQAGIQTNYLMLFVHDRPMEDDHLDFSQPLPVS